MLGYTLLFACWMFLPLSIAQNLSGIVVADDTGRPVVGATVTALQKRTSLSLQPIFYRSDTDGTGHYAMFAAPGQYTLCIHAGGLYLDPCQWGGAITTVVSGSTPVAGTPVRLRKGAKFVLRLHDNQKLLARAEGLAGGKVWAILTSTPTGPIALPVVSDRGGMRDYQAVLPLNVPMTITISSPRLNFRDNNGVGLNGREIPFQITASDFPQAKTGSNRTMFLPPDAKVIRVHAASLQ